MAERRRPQPPFPANARAEGAPAEAAPAEGAPAEEPARAPASSQAFELASSVRDPRRGGRGEARYARPRSPKTRDLANEETTSRSALARSGDPERAARKARNAELFRTLIASSSFVTIYVGAWAAVAAGILVGPYLAALLQMLDGNLQPQFPHRAWPVLLTAVAAALPIPFAARRRFDLASVAVIPMLLVVGWQIRALYLLAGIGAVRM